MKSKDKKQQKGHESTIGKIIYGFLLFMPLLAIGVTCIVNTFNIQAKENHQTALKYETNDVNNNDDLINGNIYLFSYTFTTGTNNNQLVGHNVVKWAFMDLNYDNADYYFFARNPVQATSSVFILSTANNTNNAIGYYGTPATYTNNVAYIPVILWNKENLESTFDYSYFSKCPEKFLIYEKSNEELSNIFYYSINKVEQSPLFNWSKNSVIYTGMNETCNALDITTTFIPMLLAYWLIISVIYYLYDIILIILHVFHRKIHQLEESI